MPTLHLIDGSGYMYRAFHALPPLSTSQGVPTGAVRGVASMLLRDLREGGATHVAFCLDLDSKASRAEIFPDYKATRPPAPDELKQQFTLIRDVVRSLNVPLLELAGWEADDIIATLAREAREKGWEVVVVSGDKDLMQLVHDGDVRFYDGMKAKWFDEAAVKEKWGVAPERVGDLLALTGDKVDNVPGVPGVGPKTAATLLAEFGSLDAILERAGEIKRDKLRQSILDHMEAIRLSRRLVALNDRLELGVTVDDLARKPIDATQARHIFGELEMFTLLKDLPDAPVAATATALSIDIVRNAGALSTLVERFLTQERVALHLVPSGTHPLTDSLVGIALSGGEGKASYIPIGAGGLLDQSALSEKTALQALEPLLSAQTPLKDGHGFKGIIQALARRGITLRGVGVDLELWSFLTNSARRTHELADLCRERLSSEIPAPPQDSRKRSTLAQASPEEVAPWAAHSADAIRRLVPIALSELERDEQRKVWEEVERPILHVLARMERNGIRLDGDVLRAQSEAVEQEIETQLREIHALAGRDFNPNAPAQLAEILFDELGLPVIKRGKTGPSTDAEVLEKLADEHPLPGKILEYRGLAKLKNTYLDTLPELVHADGRIHTTFNPVGAATGRLSSADPNLQNIPIRTEVGKRIRSAFIADPGHVLVSADYSQIELRVLAHVSNDRALTESFARNEDVHTRTAAETYGVTPLEVTGEMRRVAKMINYAIAYGLSPYGLSARIGIERDEAKRIIDAYFARYTGVKAWLDDTVRHGREKGYVTTLLGRRRHLPELNAKNPTVRMAAERAAVNAPIQGTAADIVKLAMLAVDEALAKDFPTTRLLLQVHDELVLEVPETDVVDVERLVKTRMERAVKLAVPLVVDIGHGPNWADAH